MVADGLWGTFRFLFVLWWLLSGFWNLILSFFRTKWTILCFTFSSFIFWVEKSCWPKMHLMNHFALGDNFVYKSPCCLIVGPIVFVTGSGLAKSGEHLLPQFCATVPDIHWAFGSILGKWKASKFLWVTLLCVRVCFSAGLDIMTSLDEEAVLLCIQCLTYLYRKIVCW